MFKGRTDMAIEAISIDHKLDVERTISGMKFKKCYIDEKMGKNGINGGACEFALRQHDSL